MLILITVRLNTKRRNIKRLYITEAEERELVIQSFLCIYTIAAYAIAMSNLM